MENDWTKEIDRLRERVRELEAADYNARLALLLNHGHSCAYTDDGELQCGECRPNWDYKKLPIKTLIFQLVGLAQERENRLKAELSEARDTAKKYGARLRCHGYTTKDLAAALKAGEVEE